MNKKMLTAFLIAEGVLCSALSVLAFSGGGLLGAISTFPYAQISYVLRWMSLSGGIGNVAAIIIYCALCLAPCALLVYLTIKRKQQLEDSILILLSIMLFAVVYLMINPGIPGRLEGLSELMRAPILCISLHSVFFAYVTLRLLRLFFISRTKQLQKYMLYLLAAVNAVFVFLIFGTGLSELLLQMQTLRSGNAVSASYTFLYLRFAVNLLPYIMDIFVVFCAISLTCELYADRFSPASEMAAKKLSRICRLSLIVTVLLSCGFNLLQLICSDRISHAQSDLHIPVFSIVFVLAILILSRLISESRALKDENDSII